VFLVQNQADCDQTEESGIYTRESKTGKKAKMKGSNVREWGTKGMERISGSGDEEGREPEGELTNVDFEDGFEMSPPLLNRIHLRDPA
jgi:hypothetical protein